MKTSEQPVLLVSRRQAAELLGVSLATVRRLTRRGILEPVRLTPEGHPRIRRDDLLALIERDRETEP